MIISETFIHTFYLISKISIFLLLNLQLYNSLNAQISSKNMEDKYCQIVIAKIFAHYIYALKSCLYYFCQFISQILTMQPETNFDTLPKRKINRIGGYNNNPKFIKCKFVSNYFQLKMQPQFQKLYLYHVDSDLPQDSNSLIDQIVKHSQKLLREKLGMVSYKNLNIWGTTNQKSAQLIKSFYYLKNGQKKDVQFFVKNTNSVTTIKDLKPEQASKVIMFLNGCIKQKQKQNNLLQLGKGKFFNPNDMLKNAIDNLDSRQDHLSVWKGYRISVFNINRVHLVQMDVSSRVLRLHNFQEILSNCTHKNQQTAYIGETVITRYGKRRTYLIQDIDFTKSPLSKFYYDKAGRDYTFERYFNQVYGKQISNKRQPLLKVISTQKKFIQNGKIQSEVNYTYIVPQLVSLVGISNQQRRNRNLMKQIAKYTKITPEQRFYELNEQKEIMNKTKQNSSNFFSIGKQVQVNGFIIPVPQIKIGNNRLINKQQGCINIKDIVKQPYEFSRKDFVIVYSGTSIQNDQFDQCADKFTQSLKKAGKTFGILVEQSFIKIIVKHGRPQAQNFIQEIQKDIQKHEPMKFILIILYKSQQKYYERLKKYCLLQKKIPVQFIKVSTIKAKLQKDLISLASNVVLQMTAKMSNVLWQVISNSEYFRQKKVGIASLMFSTSNPKKSSTSLGFVGSLNGNFSSYHLQNRRQHDTNSYNLYTELFCNWLKQYFKKNDQNLPDTIIVYREGMQDHQKKQRLPNQLQGFSQCLDKINKKPFSEGFSYNPEIIYITVDKRINTKFFRKEQYKQITNPRPGSVVFEQLSQNQYQDFHLVPHLVKKDFGTAKPTRFTISAVLNMKTSIQQIAILTYQQCYNYFNWRGSIRIPGVMMYASKLANMTGEFVHSAVSLKRSGLWFL